VPARLPEAARLQLAQTSDPIGRVLAAHGLTHVREDTPASGPGTPRELDGTAAGASAIVWSRAYRLTIDDLPAFAICEWFFRSVERAVERSMPA
jgi:chorismate-pyruvate lyase